MKCKHITLYIEQRMYGFFSRRRQPYPILSNMEDPAHTVLLNQDRLEGIHEWRELQTPFVRHQTSEYFTRRALFETMRNPVPQNGIDIMAGDIRKVSTAEDVVVMYHGTTARSAWQIYTQGIRFDQEGAFRQDFGRGFYLTPNKTFARMWAKHSIYPPGYVAAVMTYALPSTRPWTKLSSEDEWKHMVTTYRRGNVREADVRSIEGLVCVNGRDVTEGKADPTIVDNRLHQLCVKSYQLADHLDLIKIEFLN